MGAGAAFDSDPCSGPQLESSPQEPLVGLLNDNVAGTAAFMAPEAWTPGALLTTAVDIYAFGVLMWQLYVGPRRPYGELNWVSSKGG